MSAAPLITVVVIAKECLPGRVKTRLHPPLSLEEAAVLASASLSDTLQTVAALPAARRILLFDGVTPPPDAHGFDVVPQASGGLDERLAAVFDLVDGPLLLVGMDTPQLTPSMLAPVFEPWPDEVDAWFGPANDGGFWGIALREPTGDLVRGVPMSQDDTGRHQLARLAESGLGVGFLQELTDVDTIDDARAVSAAAPTTRFAGTFRDLATTAVPAPLAFADASTDGRATL
ncbi:hypothetical protein EDF46_2213 [Frondihabitans sp. PhB188]|uniref:TIGR04282 family arsenosugar biosynthesis glycosyltransferase n=1 Tax=Frondihabitans sp. PhB188 TaxID=2485200 RepID=UPI000F4A51CC|nr:DUF2064 domain-containing protein [Frondihabitans sp. PhB188]ROQ38573.1 hypothetical protein EDF46_2213 [Frondihabitans sp. PhB188]